MKKKLQRCVTLTSAIVSLAMPFAAQAACNSSLISITVLATALDFASLTACTATSGQVSLNQKTGARTTTGCITGVSGITSLATVRVKGNQAKNSDKVELTAPNSFNVNKGGDNMSVTNILFDKGGGQQTVAINGKATVTYDIGGRLNVSGGQPGGTYTGSFTVDAHCQ